MRTYSIFSQLQANFFDATHTKESISEQKGQQISSSNLYANFTYKYAPHRAKVHVLKAKLFKHTNRLRVCCLAARLAAPLTNYRAKSRVIH